MPVTNSADRLRPLYLGASIAAALLIFVVDAFAPAGVAAWPFYVIALAVAAPHLKARGLYLFSAGVTLLIVLGNFLSPPGLAPPVALFNDAVGIAIIWAATWLAVRRLEAVNRLRVSELELEHEVQAKVAELEQYRFLAENIKDVIWTIDLETRHFTYISPSVTKMRGFAPAEIIGQPATSGMTAASARYIDELLDTLVAEFNAQGWTTSPEFHSADIEELCKDGSTIWSEAVAFLRRNAQTGRLELHGVTRDITQRKQLQDALAESEQRYRMLADNATDVIWSLDARLDYAYVSPAVTQVTGYSPEEFMQHRMADLLTPASAQLLNDQVAKVWEEAERTGQLPRKLNLELEQVCRDGRITWIEMIASAAFGTAGAFAGVVGVSRDITARKQHEAEIRRLNAELEQRVAARTAELAEANLRLEERVAERTRELDAARRAAEEANQAKSRFLANMSHELRTPLNAIVGLAQVMQDDPLLSPPQQESLNIVVQSSEHLLSMINDVLDISKIEAGKMELYATDFDLHATVRALQAMLQQKADARQLALLVAIAPDVPQQVHADQGKLRQVLINLLNNALKFTHQGHVALKVRRGGRDRIRFDVEDTGPGIAPAEKEKLFSEFEQTAAGRQMQEGTGLGLPISRRLVQMMGGELTVTSQLGRGTTFTVCVPLPPAVAARPESINAQVVKGLAPGSPIYRMLIVDDIPVNREVLKRTLRPLGMAVREAEDGATALAMWESWRPDLVWLDIRMAGMSGTDVARAIRQREAALGGRHTHIIAITASVFGAEHADILAAGCDDVVTKPFRRRQIFDKLAEHLQLEYVFGPAGRSQQSAEQRAKLSADARSELPASPAPALGAQTQQGMPAADAAHVLVVDDNIVGQKLAVRLLERLKVQADVAGNGEEALAALAGHPYSLVLMDMHMPVMSGVEATRRIRAGEAYGRPAIVVLTGSTDADDFNAARAAGVDGWLVKPLRIEDLQLTLERWLGRRADG